MRVKWHNLLVAMAAGLFLLSACAQTAEAQSAEDAGETQPANQPEAVALLHRVEAATADLRTLQARIRYTRLQTLTGDEQRRFGNFYYAAEKPGTSTRFAVHFDRLVVDERARPMDSWFVFDGRWLLERDHEDKTAIRRELVPEGAAREGELSLGDGQMPIPLRLKADEVLKSYAVTKQEDEPFGDDQTLHHLVLTPRNGGADATPLELWFDSKTLQLHKVVTAEDTDEIEMVFSLVKANASIKASTFDTRLPKESDGWQVQDVPLKG